MIMAGRGRRLGELGNQIKKVGEPPAATETYDLPTLINKINELDTSELKSPELDSIQNSFKQLCTSKEKMNDTLVTFHEKSLSDPKFGRKFLIAIRPLFCCDSTNLRSELLPFLQQDFKAKDSIAETDHKKFLNGIEFFGNFYQLHSFPISVLTTAFFEYLDMLLKGKEEDMEVLTSQIFLNGQRLSSDDKQSEKFNLLQHNLRDALINKSISDRSKLWVLLAIDCISNNFEPLTGSLHDYYKKNLGDDYNKLQTTIKNPPPSSLIDVFSSPQSPKSEEKSPQNLKNAEGKKQDLSEKFTNLSMSKLDDKFKGQRKDNQKWQNRDKGRSNRGYSSSGHDDRFEKDEDFYGKQMPRRPKSDNPNKNF